MKWYNCHYCTYQTSSKRLLSIHLQDEHFYQKPIRRKLKCSLCSNKASSRIEMKNYLINTHKLSLWYKCLSCGYEINELSYMLNHLQKTHQIEAHSRYLRFYSDKPHLQNKLCPFCGYKPHISIFLWAHLRKNHNIDLQIRQYTQKRYNVINLTCFSYLL